jgi:hypothetical protein
MIQEVGYELSTTFSLSGKLRIHAVSYSADDEELSILLEILEGDGLIKVEGAIPTTVRLTPAGLIQAEELSQPGAAYLQGFVAMSFDPSMDVAYTSGFDPGIRAAGYRPFRIDGKEHINGISDEILAEIRRSRFLVADYYVAQTFRKPPPDLAGWVVSSSTLQRQFAPPSTLAAWVRPPWSDPMPLRKKIQGFNSSVVKSCGEDWGRIRQYNRTLMRLAKRRVGRVEAKGLYEFSKIAWQIAILQQALLYRIVALATATAKNWNYGNVLGSVLAARALLETIALMHSIVPKLVEFHEKGQHKELHDYTVNATFATRDEELRREAPELVATNIKTHIARLAKKIPSLKQAGAL